jgi:hypothetical protein
MNKAETEARKKYKANQLTCICYANILPIDYLAKLSKEQDKLYRIIHERADRANFNSSSL